MHFLNAINTFTNRINSIRTTFILTLFCIVLRDLRALLITLMKENLNIQSEHILIPRLAPGVISPLVVLTSRDSGEA